MQVLYVFYANCRLTVLLTRLSIVGPRMCGAAHTEPCLPKQLTALRFCTFLDIGHNLIRPLEHLRELDILELDAIELSSSHRASSWSLDEVKLRTINPKKLFPHQLLAACAVLKSFLLYGEIPKRWET